MLKAIVMMLLAIVSSSATAEWVEALRNETLTAYADPATIRKAGDMVKMWELMDYKTAQVLEAGKAYMSMRSQTEYDCKQKQFRSLVASFRSGNMGRGKVVSMSSNPTNWELVAPGSIGERLWKIACGKW